MINLYRVRRDIWRARDDADDTAARRRRRRISQSGPAKPVTTTPVEAPTSLRPDQARQGQHPLSDEQQGLPL